MIPIFTFAAILIALIILWDTKRIRPRTFLGLSVVVLVGLVTYLAWLLAR